MRERAFVALAVAAGSLVAAVRTCRGAASERQAAFTIPVAIRLALGIDEHSYLEVSEQGEEIRLRKIVPARPLGGDDPIWTLSGAGASGFQEVSAHHDRHLADGERERWRESS